MCARVCAFLCVPLYIFIYARVRDCVCLYLCACVFAALTGVGGPPFLALVRPRRDTGYDANVEVIRKFLHAFLDEHEGALHTARLVTLSW